MKNPIKMIDVKWNRRHHACYSDARLAALYDRPMTPLEVMTRRDGKWKRVTNRDRAWVGWCVLTRPHLRECMARMLERLKKRGLLTDPRSRAVIPALRFGQVTDKIINAAHAARAAAYAARAYAYYATYYAARAAAYAAHADAYAAANDADAANDDGALERKHQVADIIEMLKFGERHGSESLHQRGYCRARSSDC